MLNLIDAMPLVDEIERDMVERQPISKLADSVRLYLYAFLDMSAASPDVLDFNIGEPCGCAACWYRGIQPINVRNPPIAFAFTLFPTDVHAN